MLISKNLEAKRARRLRILVLIRVLIRVLHSGY